MYPSMHACMHACMHMYMYIYIHVYVIEQATIPHAGLAACIARTYVCNIHIHYRSIKPLCTVSCTSSQIHACTITHTVTFEQAAAIPHACLAAYAALGHVGKLINKRHMSTKSVMILGGSGGVGTFAVQLAKTHFGCYVVASCSSKNAMLIKSLGADQVFIHLYVCMYVCICVYVCMT